MVSYAFSELAESSPFCVNGQLQSVKANSKYTSGYLWETLSLRNGISIVVQNFLVNGDGAARLATQEHSELHLISFFNSFSGIKNISYTEPRVSLGDNFSTIELPGYKSGTHMDVACNTPVKTLTVCINPESFAEITGKSCEQLTEMLDHIDNKAYTKTPPVKSEEVSMAQKMCSFQTFECFMNDTYDTLYLEAKALELIALQMRQLGYMTGEKDEKQTKKNYSENIWHASEILKKEMSAPPGKLELARRVGLNHNQLVHGFKNIFGMCPYAYLRVLRLEKAYELIASRQCNVTEAAFHVGYSSLSHFTKTFREKFGINPKSVCKG